MTYDFEVEGRILFEAYSDDKKWLTWDGKPIPQWPDLGEEVQHGWKVAAAALMTYLGRYSQVQIHTTNSTQSIK